jgi:integrase/recombinase XerD
MTCSAYERDVLAWLDYLQRQGIEDLVRVRVAHRRAFLAEEQKRRPAISSQARTTAALKCLVRFLVEEERLGARPGAAAADADEGGGVDGCPDDARARTTARTARA